MTIFKLAFQLCSAQLRDFNYQINPAVYVINQTVQNLPLIQGTPTLFTVSPSLPLGLSLNSTNGTVYGVPTQITASRLYTVSACYTDCSQLSLSIGVNDCE